MRRSWGILASALFAVALEVAVNLIAASVAVPRRYYFVPIVAFAVLVALQFFMALKEQQAPGRSEERPADRQAADGRHLIRGAWHKPSELTEAGIVGLAGAGVPAGLVSWVARPQPARELALAITCCCAVLLAVLCLRIALGSRVSLEFSADGVAVRRGIGRKRRLRWDEAQNFRVREDYVGERYLVADPLPGSTWYLHGFGVNEETGVILICEMNHAGFHAAAVNAAVRYWKPRPSSRTS
jgi:hypothetical protein